MNKFLIAACLTVLIVAPVNAADDLMANFYGNTVISKDGSATIKTHYRADHTFDFVGSMMFISKTFKGTWLLDGQGNICRTYIGDVPPGTPNPQCLPIKARKIGEVWKSTDNTRTFVLKAGVQ